MHPSYGNERCVILQLTALGYDRETARQVNTVLGVTMTLWSKSMVLVAIALVIVVLSACGYAFKVVAERNTLKIENTELREKLSKSENSVVLLKGSLKTQNDAVVALQRRAKERARAGDELVAKAREESRTTLERAKELLLSSGNSIDQCAKAAELIDQEIQNGQ